MAEDKDTWDIINDKYYTCSELIKEVRELLEVRKMRKDKEELEMKAKKRWTLVKKKTLKAKMKDAVVDVLTEKATTGTPSREDIQKMYGNNSVFGFKDRKLKS